MSSATSNLRQSTVTHEHSKALWRLVFCNAPLLAVGLDSCSISTNSGLWLHPKIPTRDGLYPKILTQDWFGLHPKILTLDGLHPKTLTHDGWNLNTVTHGGFGLHPKILTP